MKRRNWLTVLSVFSSGLMLTASGMEFGTNRSGGDYDGFFITQTLPSICKEYCDRDLRCQAWALAMPGVYGTDAPHCALKQSVPNSNSDSRFISGVKGMEYGTDRMGGMDFRRIDLAQPDPALCMAACGKELECSAWTYVKLGVIAPGAICYLKRLVTKSSSNPNCVSGVKMMEYSTDRPAPAYRVVNMSHPDPALCMAACGKELNCHAWTYTRPEENQMAKCYLRSGDVPNAVASNRSVSGVKAMEYGTERPGVDFVHIRHVPK